MRGRSSRTAGSKTKSEETVIRAKRQRALLLLSLLPLVVYGVFAIFWSLIQAQRVGEFSLELTAAIIGISISVFILAIVFVGIRLPGLRRVKHLRGLRPSALIIERFAYSVVSDEVIQILGGEPLKGSVEQVSAAIDDEGLLLLKGRELPVLSISKDEIRRVVAGYAEFAPGGSKPCVIFQVQRDGEVYEIPLAAVAENWIILRILNDNETRQVVTRILERLNMAA